MSFISGIPYFAWAFGAATSFYLVVSFATEHLHPDKKAHLSLWLQGDYQSTWSSQFCSLFDSIFGEKHWKPRCILLSSLLSVIAVLALYLLFDRILGLISLRTDIGLSLFQALLIGAVINIIPDYISLYETRLLLKVFDRIKNPFGQLIILMIDVAATGLIIWLGVKTYLWATGKPDISLVEMVALFSIYAIFFYSTFLTSIWAWAFCVSSWLSRLSAKLRNWLDVQKKPGKVLALLGAMLVFLGTVAIKPAISVNDEGRTVYDDFLCEVFPTSACIHVARLMGDDEKKLALLERICKDGVSQKCVSAGMSLYQVKPKEAMKLWQKSCENGNMRGCTNLGLMFERGIGTPKDFTRARKLYQQVCEGDSKFGCTYLAFLYLNGQGVEKDNEQARNLFKQACDDQDMHGCFNLAITYNQQPDSNLSRAQHYFEKSCSLGYRLACDFNK